MAQSRPVQIPKLTVGAVRLRIAARACAIPKFAIVGLGLLYLIVGLVMMPIVRRRGVRERVEEYRGRADTGMSTDEILSLTRQDLD